PTEGGALVGRGLEEEARAEAALPERAVGLHGHEEHARELLPERRLLEFELGDLGERHRAHEGRLARRARGIEGDGLELDAELDEVRFALAPGGGAERGLDEGADEALAVRGGARQARAELRREIGDATAGEI